MYFVYVEQGLERENKQCADTLLILPTLSSHSKIILQN